MAKHVYVIRGERTVNLKSTFAVGKGDVAKRIRIAFVDNRFETDDDELAQAMDDQLAAGFGISQFCTRVDSSAAATMVKARMASAAKGGLTASLVQGLEQRVRSEAQAKQDALTAELELNDEIAVTTAVVPAPEAVASPAKLDLKLG